MSYFVSAYHNTVTYIQETDTVNVIELRSEDKNGIYMYMVNGCEGKCIYTLVVEFIKRKMSLAQ